jgi:murein DD-endopeptidase MepM/ murein hydrolase activator NlpD
LNTSLIRAQTALRHGAVAAREGVRRGMDALRTWATAHPKAVLTSLSLALLGGGGGAFAVATLAPDVANLPVRTVIEAVEPLPLAWQVEALERNTLSLYRTDVTRPNDTVDTLLKRLGISDPQAAIFLRSDANSRQMLLARTGRAITAEASADNRLRKLSLRWSPNDDERFQRLVIERRALGYTSKLESAVMTPATRMGSGTVRSSLFAATDDARIPDTVAAQMAEIFSGDIDFHRALRKGDRFSVVYESLEADGEPMRAGRVLSAEFVNAGKTFQAMWFQVPGASKGAYYTPNGDSLRRAYLASPLEFSRVTSGFKMRFHPILQSWRAHLGVDYAAPTGTAVRSVADGEVEFAGVQSGFGNVVFVRHRNNHSTVYAHLSRIGVRKGERVEQGQNLGAVGATGWATGPHLHFEFRVNGAHQDPLTLARQSDSVPVTAAARPVFDKMALMMRRELKAAASLEAASVQ